MEKKAMILETRKDKEKLDDYVSQLIAKGFVVEGKLGFKNRAKEIVRIVKEAKADMLVIGAHGHTGLKDLIYGETTDAVRHELSIPV
jgi:manganese transport protein